MKNRNAISTTILLLLACFSLSVTANMAMADQNVSFRVQLRPHVFANVVSTVVTNPSFPTGGMTVLTVHGFAHTGSTFENLTQAIFNSPQYGSSVSNVVLMNAVSPYPAPFFLADSGAGPVIVAPFVLSDPVRGLYVHIPAPNWLGFFFTNLLGNFVPGTPSPEEAVSRG